MSEETPVQKFYIGSHIFITGGTGFLGKVLIEKLLRSCPGIGKIYLLIRIKKGVDPAKRFEALLADKLFERLKKEEPNFAEKLEIVPGDCSEPFLGVSSGVLEILLEKVDIVFHLAATVRFNENLKKACAINVFGTKHVLEFCKSLKNLKSVIHVSTAYSNCHLNKIEDTFYDPPLCHDRIEKLCEALTDDEIDILTPRLLQEWPNSYTLTKAIAETKVKSLGVDLPICIFRPAIVTASYAEPAPGWIDNFNGPTGLFLQSWLGILKTIQGDVKAKCNFVPVDLTASALILVAKGAYDSHRENPEKIKIYGFESNSVNPWTWSSNAVEMNYWNTFFPLNHAIGVSHAFFVKSKTLYEIQKIILEIIPGYILDTFLRTTGKKPRMIKLYKIIHTSVDVISFFTRNTLNYESKNMKKLFQQCTNEDKILFSCDLKQIDWSEYIKIYLIGIRKYLMKESEDTIEKAKVRQKKLYWIYVASRITLSTIVVWMGYALGQKIAA